MNNNNNNCRKNSVGSYSTPLVTAEEKTQLGYSLYILYPVSYARVKLSLQHDVFSALT